MSDTGERVVLTRNQFDILHHTAHRAAGGRYCGGGPDMDRLVELGYMQLLGKASWCPDEYYGITTAGMDALRSGRQPSGRYRVVWSIRRRGRTIRHESEVLGSISAALSYARNIKARTRTITVLKQHSCGKFFLELIVK